MDEDSIDLEALQAQIDMSMAFAEEMVSSWVKPSRKLSKRSHRDLEAELKEYMRRPPRLGVGAAIPESANSSRDAARLKGQLIGKGTKRFREDEPDSKEKDGMDSEGEIRGRAIKKKARVDPFANDGKKKKKHKAISEDAPVALKPPAPEEVEKEELEEVVNMVTEGIAGPSIPCATPKRRKTYPTPESSLDLAQTPAPPIPLRVPVNTSPPLPSNNQTEQSTTTSTERKIAEDSTTTAPATPLQLRRQAQSAALLKFPLLNLTPFNNDNSEHEDDKSDVRDNDSPKKKRKRKKKKKKKGDASPPIASEAPAVLL